MEALTPFLFPALLVVAFYFLIIRPARTRTRAATQLRDQLAPGLEVMTTSGVFATVVSVDDSAVALEVAPGVTMRFAKAAIARVLTTDEAVPTDETVDDSGQDDPASPVSPNKGQPDDQPGSDQPSR